jgi:anti-sigma factor RsiW
MVCVLISGVLVAGGLGTLAFFGYQRVSRHLSKNPQAAKRVAEVLGGDILMPLLVGEKEEETNAEEKPRVQKIKGARLV